METTITRFGWSQHRVSCSHCGFSRTFEDALVSVAITTYRNHDCSTLEEYCPVCTASVDSFEHAETCGVADV